MPAAVGTNGRVILDWMMPGLSGVDVFRAIREDPNLAGITVVMMTARTGMDSENEARAAGVDHFIPKPSMPRQLSTPVDDILTAARRDAVQGRPPAPAAGYERPGLGAATAAAWAGPNAAVHGTLLPTVGGCRHEDP